MRFSLYVSERATHAIKDFTSYAANLVVNSREWHSWCTTQETEYERARQETTHPASATHRPCQAFATQPPCKRWREAGYHILFPHTMAYYLPALVRQGRKSWVRRFATSHLHPPRQRYTHASTYM